MPKRSRKHPEADLNQTAARIVAQSTGQPIPVQKPEKNAAAVELGRLGGLKGGKARAKKLLHRQRRVFGGLGIYLSLIRFLGLRGGLILRHSRSQVIFNDLVGHGIHEGVHITVMHGKYQILKRLIL